MLKSGDCGDQEASQEERDVGREECLCTFVLKMETSGIGRNIIAGRLSQKQTVWLKNDLRERVVRSAGKSRASRWKRWQNRVVLLKK